MSRNPALDESPHAGLGANEIEGELGVAAGVPVADQKRDVGAEALGTEGRSREGRGHREEHHRAALGRSENRSAFAAGDVDADHGDVSQLPYGSCQTHGLARVSDDDVVGNAGRLQCARLGSGWVPRP